MSNTSDLHISSAYLLRPLTRLSGVVFVQRFDSNNGSGTDTVTVSFFFNEDCSRVSQNLFQAVQFPPS